MLCTFSGSIGTSLARLAGQHRHSDESLGAHGVGLSSGRLNGQCHSETAPLTAEVKGSIYPRTLGAAAMNSSACHINGSQRNDLHSGASGPRVRRGCPTQQPKKPKLATLTPTEARRAAFVQQAELCRRGGDRARRGQARECRTAEHAEAGRAEDRGCALGPWGRYSVRRDQPGAGVATPGSGRWVLCD